VDADLVEEGDVEPDDIAPAAATNHSVGVKDETVRGLESWPREPAGPESVPSRGWHGMLEPVNPLPAGISLACPDGHTGSPTANTPVRGHSHSLGGSVAEWLACRTQARKSTGSNRSRGAVE